MVKKIDFGQSSTFTAGEGDHMHLLMNVHGFHGTVNTAIAAGWLDAGKIDVKLIRHGANGKKQDIVNVDLDILFRRMYFLDHNYDFVSGSDAGRVRVTPAAAVYGENVIPLVLTFPNIFNNRDGEKISVEIEFGAGALDASMDEAKSYIQAEFLSGVDLEYTTPEIEVIHIPDGQKRFSKVLGDNVKSVAWINTDATGNTYNDRVIEKCEIESDYYRQSFTNDQLQSLRYRQFDTKAKADARCQSFLIHGGKTLQRVTFTADLEETNVADGKNYLVIVRNHVDAGKFNWAAKKGTKHRQAAYDRVK